MSLILRYPKEVDNDAEVHTSYLAFTATEQVARSDRRSRQLFDPNSEIRSKDLGTVYLYMPEIGEVSYNQNYDESGRGIIEQIASVLTNDDMSIAERATESIGVVGRNLGGDTRDALTQTVANNQETAKYQSPELRKQTFTFQLRPKNLGELKEIARIIKFFKFYSSPRANQTLEFVDVNDPLVQDEIDGTAAGYARAGTTFAGQNLLVGGSRAAGESQRLKFPSRWIVQEISKTTGRVIRPFIFGPAVCTSVAVNMTPESYWIKFQNGDPAYIDLTLAFTETGIIFGEDILELGI